MFDAVDDPAPARTVPLEPAQNRTSCFWHVFVPDVGPGQVYTWRVHGDFDPAAGLRHDDALDQFIRGHVHLLVAQVELVQGHPADAA